MKAHGSPGDSTAVLSSYIDQLPYLGPPSLGIRLRKSQTENRLALIVSPVIMMRKARQCSGGACHVAQYHNEQHGKEKHDDDYSDN